MGQAAMCCGRKNSFQSEPDLGDVEEPQPQPQPSTPSTNQEPHATYEHPSDTGNFYRDHAGYKREPTKYGPVAFSYHQLEVATNNFDLDLLVGTGGFGSVYSGVLETGQKVAIKQLDRRTIQNHQEFQAEVIILSMVRHPNIINMIGYCSVDRDTRLIVYELMSLGSLESCLRDPVSPLDWNSRMTVAAGTAKALRFLHEEAIPPVIYRDLKPSNILLGEGHYPKLSDLGLSVLSLDQSLSHVTTAMIMGTHGYCAPEYASKGCLTYMADVFGFGVVLLELITGRPGWGCEDENDSLVDWTGRNLTEGHEENILDPKLRDEVPVETIRRAVKLAVGCVKKDPSVRPKMTRVLEILEDELRPSSSSSSSGAPEEGEPISNVDRKGKRPMTE